MVLATLSDAADVWLFMAAVYAALALAFVALGRFARRMWRRREVPQSVLARVGQLVICGLVVASLPILLLSFAAISCPPDAYECPL
jgi:hypothetical protein